MIKQLIVLFQLQNKIKNGEWDGSEHTKLHDEVEDFIAQGQKINAIKHYRHVMDEIFDTEISLKGAKDYVDALAEDMRRRGVIE